MDEIIIKNTHDFKPIEGKYVNLREVEIEDAAFILKIRTTDKASQFLHKTSPDVQKQIDYLKNYKKKDNEWYFIVTDKKGKAIGCIGIYDIIGTSVCTGRWVMTKTTDARYGIESDLLVKKFVFYTLKATEIRATTTPSNKNILSFLHLWNYNLVSENSDSLAFFITKEGYEKNKAKIERFCK